MDNSKNVLIISEHIKGSLTPISLELLGIGRKLADDLEQNLIALVLGHNVADVAKEAIAHGADTVFLADSPILEGYSSDGYTLIVTKLCRDIEPTIVLAGQTDMGIDLMPRLAGRLGGGLSMDCLALAIDPETNLLLQTRPVFGGNAHATMMSRHARPQMATVRPYAMEPAVRDDSRRGEVNNLNVEFDPSEIKTSVFERVTQETEGVKLEEARVIVAGGHGMGSADNFARLSEVVRVLGGALGATRPVCEEGWTPSTAMVGQTGKVVSPDLYLAIGVSGAMQHMAGCGQSKCIVAINNNPDANIFKVAHYGVIADCNEILPALKKAIEESQTK